MSAGRTVAPPRDDEQDEERVRHASRLVAPRRSNVMRRHRGRHPDQRHTAGGGGGGGDGDGDGDANGSMRPDDSADVVPWRFQRAGDRGL
jgi:hypothetical protein